MGKVTGQLLIKLSMDTEYESEINDLREEFQRDVEECLTYYDVEKVEVIKIVRCGECKNIGTEKCPMYDKKLIQDEIYHLEPDDYCSYGTNE